MTSATARSVLLKKTKPPKSGSGEMIKVKSINSTTISFNKSNDVILPSEVQVCNHNWTLVNQSSSTIEIPLNIVELRARYVESNQSLVILTSDGLLERPSLEKRSLA